MTIRTRSLVCAIVAAIAAATCITAADGRELRSAQDTGEPRDLVNRPDCWTETAAPGIDGLH